MRPPICCVCYTRFSPSSSEGGLVYFKLSEQEEQFNQRMKDQRMVGHPKGRDWFCEQHFAKAKSLNDLTLKEALPILRNK